MDNIYKAVQLTIDSENLALSKTPTHVYIANQYVDTNDTPLITAPFIIQKPLENGTGVVDIVSSTIGSIYEVRLLCDAEVLISGYFYMPPMNVNFSELELYTSYPPRTPPVVNEFWQKTENFILEKTNTLLNFVQVFNSLSSMRLSLGYLEELATTKKSNLVSAINEVYKRYEGVGDLYEKNVEAGAGADGWTTDLVGENGLTQKQINDKNAFFYVTVADMVADTKLKAGKAVITHGYYAPNDGGGARYLIKDTATDYSIPVANNLHAVFADSFDIRKFGIRNNGTLDQTTEIQRMVNYADSRVYEIDFLNFSLMSPKTTVNYKTGTNIGRGMAFSYVHKLKNLFIANDKTKTLQHGDCCIFFLPKVDGMGTFELDTVTFDPFVANYNITAGDGDGYMHGFIAAWHKDFATGWPANQQFMTGYSIVYNNINFVSPAVSYNLAVNFWCREIRATNITGEYWGLYIWHWCDSLYAENVHGVFRDDLHAAANPKRVLVTNLFQEEQEVGYSNFAYTQTRQDFKNISCIKKTDGSYHSAIVRQGMGKPTLKEFVADTVKGQIRWYMGQPTTQSTDYHILSATIKNCNKREFIFWCGIDSLKVYDCILQDYINSYLYTFNDVYFENAEMPNAAPFYNGIVNKFVGVNCNFKSVFGLIRGYPTVFNDIKLVNPTVTKGWLIAGYAKKITIYGGVVKDNYFAKLIYLLDDGSTTPVPITIKGMDFEVGGGDGGHLIYTEGAKIVNAKVQHNGFKAKPNFVLGATGTLIYEYNSPILTALKTYDPPSLATATQQSANVILSGAKLGDVITVSFSNSLQGTRMWAEVTAADTVTVYHRNDTGVTVDLPSGTLTVKIV